MYNNLHLSGERQKKAKPERQRQNFKGKKVLEKNRLLNQNFLQALPVEWNFQSRQSHFVIQCLVCSQLTKNCQLWGTVNKQSLVWVRDIRDIEGISFADQG